MKLILAIVVIVAIILFYMMTHGSNQKENVDTEDKPSSSSVVSVANIKPDWRPVRTGPSKCFACEAEMPDISHPSKCFSCEGQDIALRGVSRSYGTKCFSC